MQPIIIEKPYKFIPPWRGTFLPFIAQKFRFIDWYLRRKEGVVDYELRGLEHLEESIAQGHGTLLAPNHCRYADPVAMGFIARSLNVYPFQMASWHLFHHNAFQSWALTALGGFSIYREGPDRQSLDTAIDILTQAKRPLVLFPEGAVFRTNDRLQDLLDGVSLIARAAAKKRAKVDEQDLVVVHPVAIKYLPLAPVESLVVPMLNEIEKRLTWEAHSQRTATLVDRTNRAMFGLLCLKEIEYFGHTREGTSFERQMGLIDELLRPSELEYLGKGGAGPIIPRIKAIRSRIVPELLAATEAAVTRRHLWDQLSRIYLAQQIASYSLDYLQAPSTEARLLETVEQIYEDLTDQQFPVRPLKVIIRIDEAIVVPASRGRGEDKFDLMQLLRTRIESMQSELAKLSKPIM